VSAAGSFDVILADGLSPVASASPRAGAVSNALWCDWGPAPNAAWLIAPNRTVLLAQTWFDAAQLNATLRALRPHAPRV